MPLSRRPSITRTSPALANGYTGNPLSSTSDGRSGVDGTPPNNPPRLGAAVVRFAAARATTVTFAVPLTPPALAVMVYGPPAFPSAVYRPPLLRLPRPASDQVKTGCTLSAAAN